MYRPLMSYDELSGILEGSPSAFYDQLYKLLGLEQLSDALARLEAEVKQLRQPGAELRKAREALKPILESHEDPARQRLWRRFARPSRTSMSFGH